MTKILVLDIHLITEVKFSVEKTFSSLFNILPVLGQPSIESTCEIRGDVYGHMKLLQDSHDGAMVISFPRLTICGVMSKLYNREFTELDKSVKAGVGEMTNSIYGVLKSNLNRTGYALKMDVPDVCAAGAAGPVSLARAGKTLVIPFTTDYGPFTVTVTVYGSPLGKKAA